MFIFFVFNGNSQLLMICFSFINRIPAKISIKYVTCTKVLSFPRVICTHANSGQDVFIFSAIFVNSFQISNIIGYFPLPLCSHYSCGFCAFKLFSSFYYIFVERTEWLFNFECFRRKIFKNNSVLNLFICFSRGLTEICEPKLRFIRLETQNSTKRPSLKPLSGEFSSAIVFLSLAWNFWCNFYR